ncbi:MAG TPA: hypothetical protein VKJ45_27030 [Blastocatellia bacterium]|nr:hypothetical protein [Blastocatellia bacterium]
MRTLGLVLALAFSLSIFVLASASTRSADRAGAGAMQAERTIEKQLLAAPGQKLSLDLETGGNIKITGWQSNSVSVRAYLGGRDWQGCTVDINQGSDGVNVISRHPADRNSYSTDFRFEIQVPQQFDVRIKSAGGGIDITNLEGEVRGSTGGGAMNIEEAKGKLNLTTGGGNITVRNSELDGVVRTGGGRILIQDVKGDFNGTSGGGNVELRNVTRRSGESTGDALHITNAGGAITVEDAPAGADVRTGGGRIHIKSAQGFVKASTGGGAIEIDAVDGSVRATTGAGRISVHVIGASSEGDRDIFIASGTGDINLTVPPDYSMDVDFKLGYTRADKQYRIISSFPINREETSEWSSAEGTPRKYIYGRGSIGGGRNKVHIETVNGNINLQQER